MFHLKELAFLEIKTFLIVNKINIYKYNILIKRKKKFTKIKLFKIILTNNLKNIKKINKFYFKFKLKNYKNLVSDILLNINSINH